MSLLEKSPQFSPVLHAVREVRLGTPLERLPRVSWFYGELLGLRAWPAEVQPPGSVGYGAMFKGLLLEFRHDPEIDPHRRRLRLIVPSLDEFERRLAQYDWPCGRQRGMSTSDDLLVLHDPAGHMIEVRQSRRF